VKLDVIENPELDAHQTTPLHKDSFLRSAAEHQRVNRERAGAGRGSGLLIDEGPQNLAVELPDGRQRKRVDDMNLAWIFVTADPLSCPCDQFRFGGGVSLRERDECHDLLPMLLVRPPDNSGRGHGRVLEQGVLDVAGVDIEAAADDQVLLAVDDEQEAVLVEVNRRLRCAATRCAERLP